MGAGFIRRYTFDPGLAELASIEGVVIIDRTPPDVLTGVSTGCALDVAEFEDGPFNAPTELFSGTDLVSMFGEFGYSYAGVPGNNPCARSRKADFALTPEYWNGNGWISLVNKRFGRLVVTRVDSSVGEVQFTRLPSIIGNGLFNWVMTSGMTLVVFKAIADTDTATFTGAVAQRDSASATFPWAPVGGEVMNLTVDDGTAQQIGPLNVVFQSTDTTQALVIARINAAVGYTLAATQSATVIRMLGRVAGNLGNVKINSVTGTITAGTGLTVGTTAGTGNVGNISAVTFNEVKAVVEAAVDVTRVDRDANGNLRLSLLTGSELYITSASTGAAALGFPTQQTDQEPSGAAFLYSGTGTFPTTFAGGEFLTLGFDDDVNVQVTFASGDQTQAQAITKINSFFSRVVALSASSVRTRLGGLKNGGQVRIVAASPLVLTALGLAVGTNQAYANADSFIPAGTQVRNAAGLEWVTMQTLAITAANAGPYSVKVRPGLDDGTLAGTSVATATVLPTPINSAAYSATNANALTAALTEPQLDARYQSAWDATLNPTTVAKEVNLSFTARSSNANRIAGRSNAVTASSQGLAGRRFAMRPPLGTTRANAKSTVQQPGAGTYRQERVIYCYPGVNTSVPQIANRGVSGGAGFTADGIVDVGSDSWLVGICTQLPPEQNPGQETAFALNALGLERNNPDIQSLTMADYVSFKASGICAPRMDNGVLIFQSGINDVDPAAYPSLAPTNRGRFSDFVGDTLSVFANKYSKQMASRSKRAEVFSVTDSFLSGLLSKDFPDNARIDSYSIDGRTGNTPASLAAGVYRIIVRVRMNPDLDVIVYDMTIGPSVIVQLQAA